MRGRTTVLGAVVLVGALVAGTPGIGAATPDVPHGRQVATTASVATPRALADAVGVLPPSRIPLATVSDIDDHDVVLGETAGGRVALHDLTTGATTLLPDPPGATDAVTGLRLSDDGRWVAFLDGWAQGSVVHRDGYVLDTDTGRFDRIPPLGPGLNVTVSDVNDAGVVVGSRRTAGGSGRGFAYDAVTGTIQDLEAEGASFGPSAINDLGWVAGSTEGACTAYHLDTQELVRIGGPDTDSCVAMAISDAGWIVGFTTSYAGPSPQTHAFTYDLARDDSMAFLREDEAWGVSDSGIVLGWELGADGWVHESVSGDLFQTGYIPGHDAALPIRINARGTILAFMGRRDDPTTVIPVRYRAPDTPAHSAFVDAAFADFLARPPSPSERDARVLALNTRATTRAAVVTALSRSDEWLRTVVDRLYRDTLGRAPDPAGLAFWTARLRAGARVDSVAASFYSSDEYFRGLGGGTVEAWVGDLYAKILGRTADPAGLAHWVRLVPEVGRGRVALALYRSIESRRTRVTALYQHLLGRGPDAAGRDFWADRIQTAGDVALAASLAASDEYLRRAATR